MKKIKDILFVSYIKNKGVRRICFILGVLLAVLPTFIMLSEIFVSKNYDSLYDSVRYASEKEKLFVFNHYKYDCGGCKAEIDYEWWKNNLISNKEITKYKDYDCSRETNTDHIDVCERVKTYLKQKVKIRYIKTEYFKLLKIILILFYFPFIIACIIKWIVSGFKQSNSGQKNAT